MNTNNWPYIERAIENRILILDGAMGTMLQVSKFEEADFRGERFADWPSPLRGNNDLLNLTKPDAIGDVHDSFLAAGADLIETNTFNATSVSQNDYGLSEYAPEIAKAGAQIARARADAWTAKTPEKPRGVLGAIGPLSKTLSLSPKVEDPGYREVDFDHVRHAYRDQINAMFDDVDALLIETVFDTLNAKAALFAIEEVKDEFIKWLETRKFAPVIKALKKKLKTMKDEELDFQSKKISDFNSAQADIISERIIQKITKQFANHLKDTEIDSDTSLELIQRVFQLELETK